jgi:hypothetical protein
LKALQQILKATALKALQPILKRWFESATANLKSDGFKSAGAFNQYISVCRCLKMLKVLVTFKVESESTGTTFKQHCGNI